MKKLFFSLSLILSLVVSTTLAQVQRRTMERPKFVFLFIGDGMGLAQVSAAEAYLSSQKGEISNTPLSFTQFPVTGFATTYSANSYITCSAAAGTALSTGYKTKNGMLGMDPDTNKLMSITYKLKEAGIPIGIVTSVSLDHATPGAFYATTPDRKNYYDIAVQIPQTEFEFFGGGGFIYPTGKEKDQKSIYAILEEGGYAVAKGFQGYLDKKGSKKIVMVQDDEDKANLMYAIDRSPKDLSLKLIVAAAIDHLYGPKGFFIMAEGGKIDWAGHGNDAKTNILETLDFADAIDVAVGFAKKYPNETLIIVTADHETGGMSLGREKGYVLNLNELAPQIKSAEEDKDNLSYITELNEKANVGWTTSSHTGIAVPVFATGAGSRLFMGRMDNTDIPKRIVRLMGLEF